MIIADATKPLPLPLPLPLQPATNLSPDKASAAQLDSGGGEPRPTSELGARPKATGSGPEGNLNRQRRLPGSPLARGGPTAQELLAAGLTAPDPVRSAGEIGLAGMGAGGKG
jgi:hypothetical protein